MLLGLRLSNSLLQSLHFRLLLIDLRIYKFDTLGVLLLLVLKFALKTLNDLFVLLMTVGALLRLLAFFFKELAVLLKVKDLCCVLLVDIG